MRLACQAIGLLATLGAATAVATRPPGVIGFLLLAAFVKSATFTFFALAEFAAVRDVVDESQRATAYAFYEAEPPVSTLLGRPLGGGLLSFGRAVPGQRPLVRRLRVVPEAVLGRTIGVIAIVTDGAGPLGGVAAGCLLAAWGSHVTGWLIAVGDAGGRDAGGWFAPVAVRFTWHGNTVTGKPSEGVRP